MNEEPVIRIHDKKLVVETVYRLSVRQYDCSWKETAVTTNADAAKTWLYSDQPEFDGRIPKV